MSDQLTAEATCTPGAPDVLLAPVGGGPTADCGICGEPTFHPSSTEGVVHCPTCAWQQAGRYYCM
ncbi:hypothetical protein LO771_17285 [Streptacidiphilus sp. ASG 303]|uniref:hypothetical protein n=1 Tax=Streptacidiphilus sp. ASG 303 TaxID=2896847 RepID=UPI001E2C05B4|nr:hypothetical protein [Streptacidiphilus sp. ASG 303]MCD0484098.1 hypothetical protein [Streptacidiphilus sp. ASG 303]